MTFRKKQNHKVRKQISDHQELGMRSRGIGRRETVRRHRARNHRLWSGVVAVVKSK